MVNPCTLSPHEHRNRCGVESVVLTGHQQKRTLWNLGSIEDSLRPVGPVEQQESQRSLYEAYINSPVPNDKYISCCCCCCWMHYLSTVLLYNGIACT